MPPSKVTTSSRAASVKAKARKSDGASPAPQTAFPPGSDIRDVTFSLILNHAQANLEATLKTATAREKRSIEPNLYAIRYLRPYWSTSCGRDVPRRKKGWMETLTATEVLRGPTDAKGKRRTHKASVAEDYMARLIAFANEYKAEHGLIGKVAWKRENIRPSRPDWYERDDIARILWVIRGRVWDRETHAWKVDKSGARVLIPRYRFVVGYRRYWDGQRWVSVEVDESKTPKGQRLHCYNWMARFIIAAVYTGSTGVMLLELQWNGTPDGDHSYVDLITEIEGRRGHLYRLGSDVAPGNMAGVAVKMTRRLIAHMERWHALDKRYGFSHVIHMNADDHYNVSSPREPISVTYRAAGIHRVLKEGGLEPLDYKGLKQTTVAWILRAGQRKKIGKALRRFKPSLALMRSTAFFVGQRYGEFADKYTPILPKFLRKQLQALRSLPETVK